MVTKVQSLKAGSLKKEHFRGYGNEAKPDSAPQEFKLSLHLLRPPHLHTPGALPTQWVTPGRALFSRTVQWHQKVSSRWHGSKWSLRQVFVFFFFLRHPQHIKKRCVSLNATNLVSYSTPYRWKRITTVVCSHCLSSQGQSWPQHNEFH